MLYMRSAWYKIFHGSGVNQLMPEATIAGL
jgi:hypothetical protein